MFKSTYYVIGAFCKTLGGEFLKTDLYNGILRIDK